MTFIFAMTLFPDAQAKAQREIDAVIGDPEQADVFKYHFGVKQDGNCDPRHDAHGELTGKVCHTDLRM